jgi:TatD DNase family protein
MTLTDTHIHLHNVTPEVAERFIRHARDFGTTKLIVVSMDVATSLQTIEYSRQYEGVYAAIGIHPMRAHEAAEGDYQKLRDMVAANKKIVCFGEVGLDYGMVFGHGTPDREKPPASPALQEEVFRWQIRLARELKIPMNIHTRRNSWDDLYRIMKEEHIGDAGGILHQFMANDRIAGQIMDLGLDIGISLFIIDPRADRLRAVVKNIPLDRMVLETDTPSSPYPPETTIPGEPMHSRLVAEKLAELRGLTLAEVDSITSANVKRIFGI